MSRFFSKELDSLSPYTPGEQPKAAGLSSLIKLNTNENPYGPGPLVEKILGEQCLNVPFSDLMRLYPDPECKELVSAIEDYYGLASGQAMVGNGSDEILGFAFMAYTDTGREIVFPEISYGFYPVFSRVFKTAFQAIPLKEDLTIEPSDYYNAQGTVVIANPNAPTGIALSRKEIEGILRNNPENLVVIDEAYVDFGGESCIPLIGYYDNLLVIQTLSKSRSLAGCRVGFAVANEEIIKDMNRIKYSFNPYNLDRLAIRIAAAAMKDKETFEANRLEVINNREWFIDEMTKRGFLVLPSSANFVFVKVHNHQQLGGEGYYQALRAKNILVRHFDKDKIRDYVRITIGKKSDLEQLLSATDDIFQKLQRSNP
jgi:histidinol-phosphate aminotransferase